MLRGWRVMADADARGLTPLRLDDSPEDPVPAPRRGRGRWPAWATRSGRSGRRRDRVTAYFIGTAVLALVAATVVVGTGAADSVPRLGNMGAWLPNSGDGSTTHVNGPSGRPDGRVTVPGAQGHDIKVTEDGSTVVVVDETTGTVSRVDPSRLDVPSQQTYEPGALVVSGGGGSWLVDEMQGTVQLIDTTDLKPLSARVDMGARPIGRPQADSRGTLWVPLPSKGQLVPVNGATPGAPILVGPPDPALRLTLAADRPVVTSPLAGTVTVATGKGLSVRLPPDFPAAGPDARVLTPETTPGTIVPVLAPTTGQLALVDIDRGLLTSVALPSGPGSRDYAPPQVLGTRVFIPDRAAGNVVVYDTAKGVLNAPIPVTNTPAPAMDAFVRGDMLWVNDRNSSKAVVVEASGQVHRVDKYGTPASPVPDGSDTGTPSPKPSETPRTGDPGGPATATDPGSEPGSAPGSASGSAPAGDPLPPATRPGADPGDASGEPPLIPRTQPPPQPPAPPAPLPRTSAPPTPSAPPAPTPPPPPPPPPPTTTSQPPPAPSPPGVPQVTSGPGWIRVVFSPSAGQRPTGYTLAMPGNAAGMTVTPNTPVGPGGPFQFTVRGGLCDQQYSFRVVATYPGGGTTTSSASPPARPCTVPGTVGGLKATPSAGGHGGTLTWQAAPANGGTLTYRVEVNGVVRQTNSTSITVDSLRNSATHQIRVTAQSAAGRGPAATTALNLTPPPRTLSVGPNRLNTNPVNVREAPNTQAAPVTTIPGGQEPAITVHCQTRGGSATRDDGSASSTIWDRVTVNGRTGWITDLYVRTTNSDRGTFSPNQLWQCT